MDAAQNFNQMLAMRVFVRVVEAGTFTNAANSLRMPKPTVTKLVQGLESHLRIKLLNRTTRRVTVTPDGSAYYERVVRLLGDLEDIESSVTHAKERPRGRLRIDAGAAMSNFLILPALPGFLAKYPEIARRVRRQRPARGSHRRQRRLRDPRRPAARAVAGGAAHRRPALDDLRDARVFREARRSPRIPPIWNPAMCSPAISSRAAAACGR